MMYKLLPKPNTEHVYMYVYMVFQGMCDYCLSCHPGPQLEQLEQYWPSPAVKQD